MEPWIGHWLDALQPDRSSPEDVGLLLLTTQMVRARSRFTVASSMAVRRLAQGFERSWSTHPLLQHIPTTMISKENSYTDEPRSALTRTDGLTESIHDSVQRSRRVIESIEATLRVNSVMYSTNRMECLICARRHPSSARKCHFCNNLELRVLYCTCELRVAEYMKALRRAELWGTSAPLEALSVSEILFRVSCARRDLTHSCDAGLNCPLTIQMEFVVTTLQRLLDDCAGLNLDEMFR